MTQKRLPTTMYAVYRSGQYDSPYPSNFVTTSFQEADEMRERLQKSTDGVLEVRSFEQFLPQEGDIWKFVPGVYSGTPFVMLGKLKSRPHRRRLSGRIKALLCPDDSFTKGTITTPQLPEYFLVLSAILHRAAEEEGGE